MPVCIDPAQIIVSADIAAGTDIFNKLFPQGRDETAVPFVVEFPVFIDAVFCHIFSGGFEQIRTDEGTFVPFFQFKIQISAQNTDLVTQTRFFIDGLDPFLDFNTGKNIMAVTEISFSERAVKIGKFRHFRQPFTVVLKRFHRDFLRRHAAVFHAAHRFLRIEQHPRRHAMEHIHQFFQADHGIFADDLFVAFAEDHSAGVTPDHTDDVARLLKIVNRRQFSLHIDPQFVTGVVERFRRTPCMTPDKVEPGSFQHTQITQILCFVEMRIAGLRKVTVFRDAPEI